jgi:hypothetical protein
MSHNQIIGFGKNHGNCVVKHHAAHFYTNSYQRWSQDFDQFAALLR